MEIEEKNPNDNGKKERDASQARKAFSYNKFFGL